MTIRYAPALYVIFIAVAALFWTQLDGLMYPADVFPKVVLGLIGVSAVAALLRELNSEPAEPVASRRFAFACIVAGSVAGYVWMISAIGYYPATVVYLLALYPVVNVAKDGGRITPALLAKGALATALVTLALYAVFTVFLKINVPMLLDRGPI